MAAEKKKMTVMNELAIQAAVVIYTGSSVCSKMASSHPGSIEIFGKTLNGLDRTGLFWMFMELVCLGTYAVLWQQIIKHFDLSIVYANRAFAIFWTFLWGIVLFHEKVKPLNLVGIVIVFIGILLVNQDAK
ncbi:MAG: transporter [Lachnospiraceae bacterium]|nr:transporter [Lachnospiraceae bacterium]